MHGMGMSHPVGAVCLITHVMEELRKIILNKSKGQMCKKTIWFSILLYIYSPVLFLKPANTPSLYSKNCCFGIIKHKLGKVVYI